MENFSYHRPTSVVEAVSMLKGAKDGKFMSGGMTLLPTIKQGLATPDMLVDLSGLRNTGITASEASIMIKAGTTHAEVAADGWAIPALSMLAAGIGDPQVRNRGTIGGSLANNDPAADYPAAAVGLGATIYTNERKFAAGDFFTGMFSTALGANEVIIAVEFPVPERAAYVKFPNPASRYALVGVFVARLKNGSVRVAVTGAGAKVFRVPEMEAALSKDFSDEALYGMKVSPKDLNSDLHASAEYRAHLIGVLAKRAVEAAK